MSIKERRYRLTMTPQVKMRGICFGKGETRPVENDVVVIHSYTGEPARRAQAMQQPDGTYLEPSPPVPPIENQRKPAKASMNASWFSNIGKWPAFGIALKEVFGMPKPCITSGNFPSPSPAINSPGALILANESLRS